MARTARQMAALKKAQAASARKRRGTGRRKPQYGVGRDGRTKLTKAQIAAKNNPNSRNRSKRTAAKTALKAATPRPKNFRLKSKSPAKRNARIDRKIKKVESKRVKKVTRYANRAEANSFTHSTQGGVYLNGRGLKAFKKGVKVNNKAARKKNKLKAKKRRR